jgi:hypothetical protein
MKRVFGLAWIPLVSACFIGETLDSGGGSASPADPSGGAVGREADAGRHEAGTLCVSSCEPDSGAPEPNTPEGGEVSDSGKKPDVEPAQDASTTDADSSPCGAGRTLLTVTVSGGSGTISSNPGGITVPSGASASACFATGRLVELEEVSQQLCTWAGVSCVEGNTGQRKCELVLGALATSVSVTIP